MSSTNQPPKGDNRHVKGRPRAVAFDCYDTLLTITDKRSPYKQLAELAGGRLQISPMLSSISLRDVANSIVTPIAFEAGLIQRLEDDLQYEVASVQPLPGAVEMLTRLRDAGYRLAIISNLAMPYAEPLRKWLGKRVDAEVLSFEVGAAKPSALMYDEACRLLDLRPSEVLMVGNSLRNDFFGAMAAGLQARHLRSGEILRQILHDLL